MQPYQELLEAIQTRLRSAHGSRNTAAIMEPEAFEEAGALADALDHNDVEDLHARHVLGWLYWLQSEGMNEPYRQEARDAAVTVLKACFPGGEYEVPEPLAADIAVRAAPDATAMLQRVAAESGSAEQATLEATVVAWRRIASAVPGQPIQSVFLSNLCAALTLLAGRTGLPEHFDEAVRTGRRALEAAPADQQPLRSSILSNLCGALRGRYEHDREQRAIDEAVAAARSAVELTPEPGSSRRRYLTNYAAVLHLRFNRTGAAADLNQAIAAARECTASTPETAPTRSARFSTLASALWDRYELGGQSADLHAAVAAVATAAAAASPEGNPSQAYLTAMGGEMLRVRAERTGDVAAIDAAVAFARQAVLLTPDTEQAAKGARLLNLSAALVQRARDLPGRSGTAVAEDLAASIAAAREAAAGRAAPGTRVTALANLVVALRERFARTGMVQDLDAAVSAGREAVRIAENTARGGYEHALALTDLGSALAHRAELTGQTQDAADVIRHTTQVVQMQAAPPTLRFKAACIGGRLALGRNPTSALDLLESAVALMPLLAPRHLNPEDTRHALGAFIGVANDAAAAVLAETSRGRGSEQAVRALGLLEQGRGVMVGRGFDVRGDVAALEREHPELARRFVELRAALDEDRSARLEADPTLPPANEQDRMSLADDLRGLLARIHALDGFADFGLPPDRAALGAAGGEGPVVIINVTLSSGHAILITDSGIRALPLPGLALREVLARGQAFYAGLERAAMEDAAITGSGEATDGDTGGATGEAAMQAVLEWLWDTVAGPVLEELGLTAATDATDDGQPPPRIWWATGGVLGVLPVHAAGYHRDPPTPSRRTVIDRVSSSYTPTVRALLHARRHRDGARSAADPSSLIVAMPTTPGYGNLPGAAAEAQALARMLPDALVLVEPEPGGGTGEPPTKRRVLEQLKERAIVHFACHGEHHVADPASSRLLLHDHSEHPLNVAAFTTIDLSHVELAYLSACDTASGQISHDLLDEAMHLTTALQLAGFPHVVGTQWMVNDVIARNIARDFYTDLLAAGTSVSDSERCFDSERCAHALRKAVLRQRNRYPGKPHVWAAHVHAGR